MDTPNRLGGIRVIASDFIPLYQIETRKRTWKQRLFTFPWRPLQKTESYQVKNKRPYLIADGVIFAHPETIDDLNKLIQTGGS